MKHEPLSLQPHTVSPRKDRMNTSSPYQPLTGKIFPPTQVTFDDCERGTLVDVREDDKFWSGILFAIPITRAASVLLLQSS